MTENHLIPLFWQHHEAPEILREEIAQMDQAGIHAFIVEARPHPHYLREEWWQDLELITSEAEQRGMTVYLFDDSGFPSGYGAGLIEEQFPQYCKRYLAQRYIDVTGPLSGCSFLIGDFLSSGEELVSVVCGQWKRLPDRPDFAGELDTQTLTEQTGRVKDGTLYWEVPPGRWRIFLLVNTREGGESHTRGYLNPLSAQAVRCYLDLIHEAHYRRLKDKFGRVIGGFFIDEPRFGSGPSYYLKPGDPSAVLPWAEDLLPELSVHPLAPKDFTRFLPLLWYSGESAPDLRYLYMDVVSRRFGQCFTGQIGSWCRAHGVRLIGHVVEENGAHARLGYGAGHYFRAMEGLSMAGIDVVCNVYPGYRDGQYHCEFFDCDADFNHWGLAKMASSCARLSPEKKGRTFCEAFGAYGWSEGLKTMKWITDAVCVRGVNILTPHAFSPRAYPDPDCPPHFYARGNNPQWPWFSVWSDYANRLCRLLSAGEQVAPRAVLYHGEAEWGGNYQPFEKAVKVLAQNQLDSTVVPADLLISSDAATWDGQLFLRGQRFSALVIPYSQYLPPTLCGRLREWSEAGLPVIFTQALPERCYGGTPFPAGIGMRTVPLEALPDCVRTEADITITPASDALICLHCRREEGDFYFLTNEDVRETLRAEIRFPESGPVFLYDALEDRYFRAEAHPLDRGTAVSLKLAPYQSLFVIFASPQEPLSERLFPEDFPCVFPLEGDWQVSAASYQEPDHFVCAGKMPLGDFTAPGCRPGFSGIIRYEREISPPSFSAGLLDLGRVGEIASIRLNGQTLCERICPPYWAEIPADLWRPQGNHLQIDVVNTLGKANHQNPFDRYWPQEPSGLLGPVRFCYYDREDNEMRKHHEKNSAGSRFL